jgi:DNA-binding IclR family transcriptional regulator
MVQQGFALRSATGRRYQLGPEIYALALKSQSTLGLVEKWRGALMRVAERTGDSAFLMVRSGYDAVCLAMQDGVVSVRTLTGGVGGRCRSASGPAASPSCRP